MKTLQKTNWILFLIIGLTISCSQIDYVNITKYKYTNSTNYNIRIELINPNNEVLNTFIIKPNESHEITFEAEGKGVIRPFSNLYRDSYPSKAIIKFDDLKCLTYNLSEGILNKLNYDNYNINMENNHKNSLVFIFDTTEFDLASDCN